MEADWKIKRFADEGERVKKMPVEDEYKRISFAEIAKEVDEVPGIYEIWTQSEIPLKVGISKNLGKRLEQHAASRDSGLKGLDSNPEQPAQLTSKGSILAKHLYFDRVLTETKDYDLTTEVGKYLNKEGYETYILSTESCDICEKCAYKEGKPCRYPDRMHPCLESHGVVVNEIVERESMEYNLGGNTILWFSMVLFR